MANECKLWLTHPTVIAIDRHSNCQLHVTNDVLDRFVVAGGLIIAWPPSTPPPRTRWSVDTPQRSDRASWRSVQTAAIVVCFARCDVDDAWCVLVCDVRFWFVYMWHVDGAIWSVPAPVPRLTSSGSYQKIVQNKPKNECLVLMLFECVIGVGRGQLYICWPGRSSQVSGSIRVCAGFRPNSCIMNRGKSDGELKWF